MIPRVLTADEIREAFTLRIDARLVGGEIGRVTVDFTAVARPPYRTTSFVVTHTLSDLDGSSWHVYELGAKTGSLESMLDLLAAWVAGCQELPAFKAWLKKAQAA